MPTRDRPKGAGAGRRRRAPAPEERVLDATRSRRALLDAALDAFAAHGFAGARVREIAAAAGVSKDLINYHFGGKAGLFREVQQEWLVRDSRLYDSEAPLAEVVLRYLHDALTDPRPMRLLAWRGLSAPDEQPPTLAPAIDATASMRRRQERGELASDLDPAAVQLLLVAAVAAPVLMPQLARQLFGIDPSDPAFEARYSASLVALLTQLSAQRTEE